MIRTDANGADVEHLHPEMRRRLLLLDTVPEVAGKWWVISGARSRHEQWLLYLRYLGGGNLAANPYRTVCVTSDGVKVKGSWHMRQSDGFAYAADLGWSGISSRQLEAACRAVGLRQTVRGEDWHYQPRTCSGWFPVTWQPPPPPAPPPIPDVEDDDVLLVRNSDTGATVLLSGARFVPVPTGEVLAALEGAGIDRIELPNDHWALFTAG